MALLPQELGNLQLVLLAVVGLSVFTILDRLFLQPLKHGLKARRLGCGSVPTEARRWPLGINTVRQAMLADRNQRMPDHMVERFAAMGRYTWKMDVLGSTNLVTAEPRNIQALLATQVDHFKMGDVRTTSLKKLFGRSIVAADGPAWHSAKEVMQPFFARQNVPDVQLLERNFQNMMRCILDGMTTQDAQRRTWTAPISLAALFPRFTLDSLSELYLGESADSLGARLRGEKGEDLSWALERIVPLLRTRLALRGAYWLYGTKELKRCAEIMKGFAREAMDNAQLALDCGASRDTFEALETLKDQCADYEEVKEQALGLLAAGTDTTAALASWVFYLLIRHPRVLAKLQGVVLEHFGPGRGGEAVTSEHLQSCTYLQHVLNETLRRHAVVPLNSRCAVRDTTLPTGGGADGTQPVFVPAGTAVHFSTHVLHRRRDLWGADADDFVPERWERLQKRPAAFEYLPFLSGPRGCPGQQVARTAAGFVVVRLLQEFDALEGLDVVGAAARDYHNCGLFCAPGSPLGRDEGVLCRLRRAQS